MNELVEAWQTWFSGSSTGSLPLWGSTVMWWGRAGKIAEFVAGLAVLAEVVGVQRLRQFGRSLSGLALDGVLIDLIRDSWALVRDFVNMDSELRSSRTPRPKLREVLTRHPVLASIYGMVAVLLGIVVFISEPGSLTHRLISGLAIVVFAWFPIVPIVFISVMAMFAVIGIAIDFLIVRPLAITLDRERLGDLIKVMSVSLFALGFHFDLLSS